MSGISEIAKRLIFWAEIRSRLITREHKKISKLCRQILSHPESYRNTIDFQPKKAFSSDRIIWQYWSQGYDPKKLPEVVKICLDSVDRFAGDALVIRLSDKNIEEYITLPQWLKEKKSQFSPAHYSDLIRSILLANYGGCWIDATILLTGEIPAEYWSADLFLFRRSEAEINKSYWENVFAAYFGWSKEFKVRILNSIIFCKKGIASISEIAEILGWVWRNVDSYPHYFFMQILMEVMIEDGLLKEFQAANDCLPHYLQQLINDPKFNLASYEEILSLTPIHKLTYKFSDVAEKLQKFQQKSSITT